MCLIGDENVIEALKRELIEETGCSCDTIKELGYVSENRAHCDYTQISYYFVVETNSTVAQPEFTEDEKCNKTQLQWHSLEEAVRLITSPVHDTNQRKFLQARDKAALDKYLEMIKA